MFGKKKGKDLPKISRKLKQGAIEKQVSYIMAVPRDMDLIKDPDDIIARLREAKNFQLVHYRMGDEEMEIAVSYNGEEYALTLTPENLELPELYTINHHFTEDDIAAMKAASVGLTSAMTFGGNNLDSYHLQLKVLDCVVPDMVGIVDFCAEKILSGLWAHMAARSEVPPAPSYIYTIQAVSGDNDVVWLHTHGLNRCGSIELEILDSDREYYGDQCNVLQTIAGNVITRGPLGEEEDAFWVSTLSDGSYLMATWVDWAEAVLQYDGNMLGGAADREEGHNDNTGVLYVYPSADDFEKKHYVHISIYNEDLRNNPIMMISSEETERMRALARERFSYFRNWVQREDVTGIIKFGLLVDDEYQNEEKTNLEHIWFEAEEIDGDTVKCLRTQDAYYIKSINEGDELEIELDKLTDWVLYLPAFSVTPDSVYLLVQVEEGKLSLGKQ